MGSITRRDLVNGTLVAAGASLLPSGCERPELAEFACDRLYSHRGLPGLVTAPADVVRADEDDGAPGGLLQLRQVIESPQHVVRAVAAEAQVDGLSRLEVLLPDRRADAVEIVRDRVADHQQVDLTLAHLGDLLGLAGEPPLNDAGLGRDGRVFFGRLGGSLFSLGHYGDGYKRGKDERY